MNRIAEELVKIAKDVVGWGESMDEDKREGLVNKFNSGIEQVRRANENTMGVLSGMMRMEKWEKMDGQGKARIMGLWRKLWAFNELLDEEKRNMARELGTRTAKELTAGDEWMDSSTTAFAKLVAREMKMDRHVGKAKANGNVVDFVYSPAVLVFVPLRLTLMEFGYEGNSESVNGTITSTENSAFRVPGGFTRTRDPKELWAKGRESLVDIFKRAMAGQ